MGKIQAEFGDQGLRVIAVNMVPQDSLQQWQAYWKQLGAGDVIWAQDTPDGRVVQAFNIQGLGATVIIDRKGRVTYRDIGATSYNKLRTEVSKVLN